MSRAAFVRLSTLMLSPPDIVHEAMIINVDRDGRESTKRRVQLQQCCTLQDSSICLPFFTRTSRT